MSFENKVGKMRDIYQRLGSNTSERTVNLARMIRDLLQAKKGEEPRMKPEDFSIQEIYQAVHSSAFPVITGTLLSSKMIAAYQLAPTIGDTLVDKFTSKLKTDTIPGMAPIGTMENVYEGGPYKHTESMEEKWVEIKGQKYGKILDITEEMLMYDQTGLVLRQAGQMGESAAMFREKLIMNTIQDITNYKAWYPGVSGTATQTDLYQNATSDPHSQDNLITNALVNHTDINAAILLFAALVDERGDPIVIGPKVLLVPNSLLMAANMIYKSSVLIGGANSQPNPYAGVFKPVTSPFLDAQSTIIWYLGDFKRQFLWKEVIPLQVQYRGGDNEAAWERDIKAQYKVRFFGQCRATDYVYVVKSTGAV